MYKKDQKLESLPLLNLGLPQIRTFHMTWVAFFLCFFAWFGVAPLMMVVKEEFALTHVQIGNIIIGSVAATIFARIAIGWVCDRVGPRRTYSLLLILGSIPVIGIAFAKGYLSFLICRVLIGLIGASFVITQYHTMQLFGSKCIGLANATSAGWGNLGAGASQVLMPLLFSGFMVFNLGASFSWRACMIFTGVLCILMGIAYYVFTKDTPKGDFRELPAQKKKPLSFKALAAVFKDVRVWGLFLAYGACFGIELIVNNVAALYFMDHFGLSLKLAGLVAGLFGALNIFARTLGGYIGDKSGIQWGLNGRVYCLGAVLLLEGITLMIFSKMTVLPWAIAFLLIFSLFVKMSQGATFSIVPFINKKAPGPIIGMIGAGGNMGAIAAGFLFRLESLSWSQSFFILGVGVCVCAGVAVCLRFPKKAEIEAPLELKQQLQTAT